MDRDPDLAIETKRLVLRLPPPGEAARLVAYVTENRDFLAPWEPARPAGFFEETWWRERLDRSRREFQEDESFRLVLFRKGDDAGPALGTCNFTSFVRGPFQACYLGYALAREAQGHGFMFEALQAALPFAFQALGFHRVMANHLPTNERSARLLRRLGFVVEGYARDYLFLAGAWRDHVLTALTSPVPLDP